MPIKMFEFYVHLDLCHGFKNYNYNLYYRPTCTKTKCCGNITAFLTSQKNITQTIITIQCCDIRLKIKAFLGLPLI